MPKTAFDFVTVGEAAVQLGVSERAVLYAIRGGKFSGARKLNPDKATSGWIIPTAALATFEAARKSKTKTTAPARKKKQAQAVAA